MKALVLGRGRSGAAAAEALRDLGYAVEFAEGYDLVVASPGLPVRSELQLGCEELRRRGWKLLAVTGSKGKSSVVKLVADTIVRARGRAVACGNYGRPVCDLLDEPPGWAVVEVSSFQLETTNLPPDAFEAAAILNLQEDHLDRHGCVAVYHGLKRRLLSMTRHAVALTDDVRARASLLAGSYFDNEVLRENGLCAIGLLTATGLDDEQIAAGFRAFEPLPHRFQTVAEQEGIRYIDDSKATSVAALVAGVKMAAAGRAERGENRPFVRLIAGGLPKGDDPRIALSVLTQWVRKVYLIGRSAGMFSAAWREAADCEVCGTLDRAVASARREASVGETVLLSPGTASFDQFKSFGERGEAFVRLVKKERKET